jgi:hypothetical protein
VIAKVRELDVKVAPQELDDAWDEDMMQRILEDYVDDPTLEELQSCAYARRAVGRSWESAIRRRNRLIWAVSEVGFRLPLDFWSGGGRRVR